MAFKNRFFPPILITSSARVMDNTVAMKSEIDRVFHTLEALKFWISITPNSKFVICDGSNYNFSKIIKESLPQASIECLYFMNNTERVKTQGKGYGEGEIIKFAITHSNEINQANCFVKCTGKLWVKNYLDCLKNWNGKFNTSGYFSNSFSKNKSKLEYLDTRFYITDLDFYKETLMNVHVKVGGSEGKSIENLFLEQILIEPKSNFLFGINPVIMGKSGASGNYYRNSLLRQLKDNLRYRLIKNNPKFSVYFND